MIAMIQRTYNIWLFWMIGAAQDTRSRAVPCRSFRPAVREMRVACLC